MRRLLWWALAPSALLAARYADLVLGAPDCTCRPPMPEGTPHGV